MMGCVSYQEEYLLNDERRARSNGLQLVLNSCHLALLLHAWCVESNDLLYGQNNPTEDQVLCLNGCGWVSQPTSQSYFRVHRTKCQLYWGSLGDSECKLSHPWTIKFIPWNECLFVRNFMSCKHRGCSWKLDHIKGQSCLPISSLQASTNPCFLDSPTSFLFYFSQFLFCWGVLYKYIRLLNSIFSIFLDNFFDVALFGRLCDVFQF
jgi:hypothetical protein